MARCTVCLTECSFLIKPEGLERVLLCEKCHKAYLAKVLEVKPRITVQRFDQQDICDWLVEHNLGIRVVETANGWIAEFDRDVSNDNLGYDRITASSVTKPEIAVNSLIARCAGKLIYIDQIAHRFPKSKNCEKLLAELRDQLHD